MLVAPLRAGAAGRLTALLATMAKAPGFADPNNALLPLGRFETLHVARMLVLDDPTLGDRAAYPAAELDPPLALAFLGFCDGPAELVLLAFAREAETGLRRIFAHCEGFDLDTDLLPWMRRHLVRPAACYVNGVGRTVLQVREEAMLHRMLREELARMKPGPPRDTADALREAVRQRGVRLTAPARTPLGWWVRSFAHLLSLPLLALLLAPALLLASPALIVLLRRRERHDPVIVPRPDPARLAMLSTFEDHDVTNPFSAIGSLKPGRFRLWLTRTILWAIDWTARHIYLRGRLARVGTIHFARWVFLDDGKRVLFASNYDGSLESYMEDFINKVGFGLNLVFSNGIGYPRTDFLIIGGAKREQDFKAFLRCHQLPTQIWYKAYPGLTTYDLARNSRIREGYEQGPRNDRESRRWLAEI